MKAFIKMVAFPKPDRYLVAAFLMIGLAFAYRLILLEIMPDLLHPDHGMIGLMAKHILEDGEFPLFWYGQDWFGPLMAFVDAFYFWIFGISEKTLKFAPLSFYILFLFFLYLFSSEVFDKKTGLWSLACALIGPFYLLDYSLIPMMGYMETLMFGTLLLWLSVRLVRSSGRMYTFYYLLIGLIAGFAWWISPLTIYFILTVGLFILLVERRKVFFLRAALGILGFVLTSLPFWIFNFRPGQGVGGFTNVFDLSLIFDGLYRMFWKDLPQLLDITFYFKTNIFLASFFIGLYLCSVLYLFRFASKDFKQLFSSLKGERPGKSILILLFLSIVLIYSFSQLGHRGVIRYLMSMYVFFLIALACLFRWLTQKWKYLGYLPIIFMVFFQAFFSLRSYVEAAPQEKKKIEALLNLSDYLLKNNIQYAMSEYRWAPRLSFVSREKLKVASFLDEDYKPYQDLIDEKNDPAFIYRGKGGLPKALRYLGGEVKSKRLDPFYVYDQMKEPQGIYQQILPVQWRSWSSHPQDETIQAYDRITDHIWSSREAQKPGMQFVLDLGSAYEIGKIQILNWPIRYRNYPLAFKLEISMDQKTWEEVARMDDLYYYYWSGPRLYPWSQLFRLVIRFEPYDAQFIRITLNGKSLIDPWMMDEIYVYEYKGQGVNSIEGLDSLIDTVDRLKLKFVYTDRWLSAKLKDKVHVFDVYTDALFKRRPIPDKRVKFGPKVAFILLEQDAEAFLDMLKDFRLTIDRKSFGLYVLFYFSEWTDAHAALLEKNQTFIWTGFGLLNTGMKSRSALVSDFGRYLFERGEGQRALEIVDYALDLYRGNLDARKIYAQLLEQLNRNDEARKEKEKIRHDSKPENESYCLFDDSYELLGFNMNPDEVMAGSTFQMVYFWRLRGDLPEGLSVFVHFEGQDRIFQNDHGFLEQFNNINPVIKGEVFKEVYALKVPEDMPAGRYRISLGLFQPKNKIFKRLVVKTDLPNKKRKVEIGQLIVKPR